MKKRHYLLFVLPVMLLLVLPLFSEAENGNQGGEGKKRIGRIDYVITDSENNLVSSGGLEVEKVYVLERNMPHYYGKRYFEDKIIKLDDDFILRINNYGYKDKEIIEGFAIAFESISRKSYGREWYDQVDENTFQKRNGKGKLTIEYHHRGEYIEFSKITFVGDQTLRCKNKSYGSPIRGWECVIRDGSYLFL